MVQLCTGGELHGCDSSPHFENRGGYLCRLTIMEGKESSIQPLGWRWDHSYSLLPDMLYDRVHPTPVRAPWLVLFNEPLAETLGLQREGVTDEVLASLFAGNELPEGADPLAQAYMGHQFGFPNLLGDGRAILLGEHLLPGGERVDIQLKGAGMTRYSRRGDGRATLSSMLREYLMSEAIYHLGIPTTRSLAVVATGEPVYRETIQEGAVLTRVAASHIRVGTFEFASRHLSVESFRGFTDYVIRRHYPHLAEAENAPLALLKAVMERQAALVAEWMRVGFIHGVMNTDNMSIAGETIDFGPCAFMNSYDPATVFSSIDTDGRYAFGNQPSIAHWNLAVFASALIPLIDPVQEKAVAMAQEAIHGFPDLFAKAWMQVMRRKLGLLNEVTGDRLLVDDLLTWMADNKADYTNTFYGLSSGMQPEGEIYRQETFRKWHERWTERLVMQPQPPAEAYAVMRTANPAFIPRNHRVEEALQAATLAKELTPLHQLLEVIRRPYEFDPARADYQAPPAGGDLHYKTFCGT